MIKLERDSEFTINNEILEVWEKYEYELNIPPGHLNAVKSEIDNGKCVKLENNDAIKNFNIVKDSEIIGHLIECTWEDDVVDVEIDFFVYNDKKGHFLKEILEQYLSNLNDVKKVGITIKRENKALEYIEKVILELDFRYVFHEGMYIKEIK